MKLHFISLHCGNILQLIKLPCRPDYGRFKSKNKHLIKNFFIIIEIKPVNLKKGLVILSLIQVINLRVYKYLKMPNCPWL